MVKRTQTIRWLSPTNRLSVLDHFVGLALKGLIAACITWFQNFSKPITKCSLFERQSILAIWSDLKKFFSLINQDSDFLIFLQYILQLWNLVCLYISEKWSTAGKGIKSGKIGPPTIIGFYGIHGLELNSKNSKY